MERPLGVTILAVLEIIAGILMLFGAAGMLFLATLGGGMPVAGIFFGMFAMAMAFIFVILAILAFIVAYGLWNGRGWAWWLAIILSIISLISNLGSLATGNAGGIVGLIIAVVILYYLTRPHVKGFFGRPA